MPKKPAPRLPEDLWTTKHQRPEGYHAQKTGSTSARRPFDCNTSKARRLPSLKNQLHFCHKTFRPQNTSKARRLPCPKNRNHVCQKTFGPKHIKGQKATMPKKPASHLPKDLWTATHQRPEGYHAQKTGSTSARRPLDRNTSKARRLPCPKNQLHVCQKTFGPHHIKG